MAPSASTIAPRGGPRSGFAARLGRPSSWTPEFMTAYEAAKAVLLWAVRKEGLDGRPYAPHNPARDVPYLRTGSTGYHTWTLEEVQQFEERHPIGTKARLALALLLLSGQRRSDVIRFGR